MGLQVSTSILTDVDRLGEVEQAHDRRNSLEVTYPYGREPLATYTFKYRSHRMYLLYLNQRESLVVSVEVLNIKQETSRSKESSPAVRHHSHSRTATPKISRPKKHESSYAVCGRTTCLE